MSGLSSLSNSGDIRIGSPNSGTVGLSGSVQIQTGAASIGSSGSLDFETGPTFGGNGGAISMIV